MKQPAFLSLLILCLGAAGCGADLFKTPKIDKFTLPVKAPLSAEAPVEFAAVAVADGNARSDNRPQIREIGTGEYTAKPQEGESAPSAEQVRDAAQDDITLNFQAADINEFIKVVLADLLAENYSIAPGVTGTVTLETASPISKEQLLVIFNEVLDMNNAAAIRSGSMYKIVPRASALKEKPGFLEAGSGDVGYRVRIVPLRYVAAQEMLSILKPFASDADNSMRADPSRNLLILGGSPLELKQLQSTIDLFDVDWMRGRSTGLYPLDHIDAATLKGELDAILETSGSGDSQGEPLGGMIRTIAIERINSILLIGSTPAALREAETWIHRLDRRGEQSGRNLYVYKVQNAKATELADILGYIFESGTDVAKHQSRSATLAPGATPKKISTGGTEGGDGAQAATASAPPDVSGISLDAASDIGIIAEDTRNALVILASHRDYQMVSAAIRKLDVVPLQVLIEVSIMEVTLTDDLNYGIEWFFKNKLPEGYGGIAQLDLGSSGINALSPSFAYTVATGSNSVRVVLNALEKETRINVLSSPSIMVLSNKTASINVGNEIPILSRQSVSNVDPSSPTVNEVGFRKTGISLSVTPRVNDSGLVMLELKQEVSNAVSTTTSNIDSPTIQQREIESTIAVNSGETIILGGLIRNSSSNTDSQLPGLAKIPLLGKLFAQTRNEASRSELIVVITPRVIRNTQGARRVTDEFRQKLRNLFEQVPTDSTEAEKET